MRNFQCLLCTVVLLLFCLNSFSQTKHNKGIPDAAHKKMNDFIKDGINTFAMTPSGGWFMSTTKGKTFAKGIPDECYEKINEFKSKGHIIKHVTFLPKGGNSWIIITNKSVFSRNIPDECHKKLILLKKQRKTIRLVAFPTKRKTDNSWVILTESGEFFARNIPDECYQTLRNLSQSPFPNQSAPRKIDFIAFAPKGGWLVIADDYHFARNINDECFKMINTFKSKKNKISSVVFNPKGNGWSVISNYKTRNEPNDPIRLFESNVSGTSIWNKLRNDNVPGASVAVVINGQVAWTAGYRFIENKNSNAVHPETMFQAASISKVIAAVGAYEMIEQNLVTLDNDLQNGILQNQIPIHPCLNYTDSTSVTVRNILNHDSGIDGNIDSTRQANLLNGNNCPRIQRGGYGGYASTTKVSDLPSTTQIMNGSGNANTRPVRITYNNTGRLRTYSGPAFTVLQQLTEELTNTEYATWMKTNVLNPLGMTDSRFTTNPEKFYDKKDLTLGFYTNKNENVRNRYPEYAAAGLYTNAEELANLIIMLNNSGTINGRRVLSTANANLLRDGTGLNTVDNRITASNSFYCHGGSNEGYRTFMIGFPNVTGNSDGVTSCGIVVLTNGNRSDRHINLRYDLVNAIIAAYGW